MSTTKEFLQFALDQLSGLDQIAHRQMMGEYIVYYQRSEERRVGKEC